MSTFRFWATLALAFVLGLVGFWLGGVTPLPEPFNIIQSRLLYALIGILIGLSAFAPIATWIVKTTTRLVGLAAMTLASEIVNQFTKATSRGLALLPPSAEERESVGSQYSGVRPIILDTSVIIDGRVLDVAKTGFLSGLILVPNFVLSELQQVADSADSIKRGRGRRGFEIVEQLKRLSGIRIEIWDKEISGKTVDDKLIRLGKIIKGRVLTCDYNLNRTATLSGVTVLNFNELSNALKSLPIPGEKLDLKIMQPGKDKDQGVGYLTDGTMVVVKEGAPYIGEQATVEVTRIIQGPAGRMIFGKLAA